MLFSVIAQETIELSSTHVIKNWAGTHHLAYQHQLAHPACIDDLLTCLLNNARPLRLCGSRYSSPSLLHCDPDVQLIDMSAMSGLQKIGPTTACFWAGTLLKDVYASLLSHGVMLPCSPGVISEQTLAGALATGTHGQGLGQSALSDTVVSLELVSTAGRIFKVDANHPHFGAFLLSLGVLGIVVSAELRIVPNQTFLCQKSVVDFSTFCDGYMQWNAEHNFVKAWWFPETQQVHVWRVSSLGASSGETSGTALNQSPVCPGPDPTLNNVVTHSRERMSKDTGMPIDGHPRYQTVERFANFQDMTGNVYEILCKGIPAAQINIEIGIPFSHCIDVLREVDNTIREQDISLHYPIIMRAVGTSSAWLSPAHSGATCYFGTVVYTDDAGKTDTDALNAARKLECVFSRHGGRPHWGKFFDPSLYDMQQLYPRIGDFSALRAVLDPRRRLAHPYIDALLA